MFSPCFLDQGTTRLLLTRIPMFREIVLMSFSCPHCGWTNNEVQSAETIGDRGCKIVLKATRKEVSAISPFRKI